ncbi:MAG: pilus assembly PilX N-terminal domain-containing protein, partial [Acidobacteria bacterium]|nr:pilus assembly PilX N-terminal domain-containing protein [Acidobacteriota bacterium]
MAHKGLENTKRACRNAERGVALVVALLAIMVLSGIGFGLMLSSSTETMIHGNFRQSGLALYAARSGVEEGSGRLGPNALGTARLIPPTDVNTGYYIQLNTSIDPMDPGCTYLGVSCYDGDPFLPTAMTLRSSIQTGTMTPYVWVKITLATQARLDRNFLDPDDLSNLDNTQIVYWNGRNLSLVPGSNPNPAYMFTAFAIEPGGARRLI